MNNRSPHLLIVYGRPVWDYTGTPVVLHRHATRFERDGWRVSVATHELAKDAGTLMPQRWRRYAIASRRWWWPPHREKVPGVLAMRRHLQGVDLAAQLKDDRPDMILTVLEPNEALIAADVARRLGCPLAIVLHDQPELFEQVAVDPARQRSTRRDADRALAGATAVFPVTDALAAAYGPSVSAKATRLLPIPAGGVGETVSWRDEFVRPHIVHVGSLHQFQIPNMQAVAQAVCAVGGRLTITSHHELHYFQHIADEFPNVVTLLPAFETSDDMLAYCAANASAMLVSYAFGSQPWGATSFPSRLLELSHLGLPVILLAPPTTAVNEWAREVRWLSRVETLDVATITTELAALATQTGWEARAQDSQRASVDLFDPGQIHAAFSADLLRLSTSG